jgi:DNA-binding beta-propeller fold protein YncE
LPQAVIDLVYLHGKIYAATDNNLYVIDLESEITEGTFPLSNIPYKLELYRDKIFITNAPASGVEIFDIQTNSLSTRSIGRVSSYFI